jgi:hypothetical protein
MLGWARCGFHKKSAGTHYTELVFLQMVGYAAHVVHCGASGPRNVDTLFFLLGWAGTDSEKSAPRYVMMNFYFCIYWDMWVT